MKHMKRKIPMSLVLTLVLVVAGSTSFYLSAGSTATDARQLAWVDALDLAEAQRRDAMD